ncbi:TlpA family protein disulfide reductase [Kangiella sediminilitoris]|uniref:Redoxin n=1 Tax=Kangiella sediminilitoris TaxID=1144748 RepID=A0A1B3BDV4_9GAMM|nr:TlpA disulfide reductase family protein [Kangiella sediminilitoris]AOE51006.1 redoxin [Kangiella sediminilitoris]
MLTIDIGPISLPFERLLFLLSLVVALVVAGLVGKRKKVVASGQIANIVIASFVVARVTFVLQYFEEYQANWLAVMDIRDGGFSLLAGAITAAIIVAIYLWREPTKRVTLISGISAGLLFIGLTQFGLWAINDTAQQLPRVILMDSKGQAIDLADVESGKPRVINLWATWCPPCRREMPILEQAQQQYQDLGFVFVNQGEHRQAVEEYLQREGLGLSNVLADPRTTLGNLLGSRALPTTLFVDANGKLRDAHLGELSRATLKAKINQLTQNSTTYSEE